MIVFNNSPWFLHWITYKQRFLLWVIPGRYDRGGGSVRVVCRLWRRCLCMLMVDTS